MAKHFFDNSFELGLKFTEVLDTNNNLQLMVLQNDYNKTSNQENSEGPRTMLTAIAKPHQSKVSFFGFYL